MTDLGLTLSIPRRDRSTGYLLIPGVTTIEDLAITVADNSSFDTVLYPLKDGSSKRKLTAQARTTPQVDQNWRRDRLYSVAFCVVDYDYGQIEIPNTTFKPLSQSTLQETDGCYIFCLKEEIPQTLRDHYAAVHFLEEAIRWRNDTHFAVVGNRLIDPPARQEIVWNVRLREIVSAFEEYEVQQEKRRLQQILGMSP